MTIRRILLGILFMWATSSIAQEATGIVAIPKEIPQAAQYLKMANELVSYGRLTKSALPLIQAVEIYRQLNVVDEESSADDTASPFSEATILADATKFADGNKNLIALIKDIGNTTRGERVHPKYGKLGGPFEPPFRYFRTISPNEILEQKVQIKSGQFVQVVLDGQAEGIREKDKNGTILVSDLKLTVFDSKGRILGQDLSMGVNCSVSFITRYTTTMTIEVKNKGGLSDNYVLYVYRR